ncbi:PREDICTED: polycomb protein Sfmbt [Rhagoletis zephyria]|uniref:polycomb protein Sfmbt n=1 Tax=Rhagoletis zephyria TaxID=28612 RepID=UPI00081192FE|nr:PREDICTED: polycomb protein Sfmbt [Rhagoletis zephyria]
MNPSELRMMWMSHYNPERITVEDAPSYFGHPSVGLSVMDELASHQQTMDLNPMMSIVGGDFSGQAAAAAAAAAALGVQPTALIAANSNDIYGLAQVGGLHQQLLQQSAAAVFQNYTEVIDDDDGPGGVVIGGSSGGCGNVRVVDKSLATQFVHSDEPQPIYDQLEDGGGFGHGLAPKQEIINIDDFVMMTDSNSYDGTDFMADEREMTEGSRAGVDIAHAQDMDENGVLVPLDNAHKLMGDNGDDLLVPASTSAALQGAVPASSRGIGGGGGGGGGGPGHHRSSQRKTRKIEPVNRPGLVLKTPIAYKGNIDPSVIPIQKDGMAVCERCGAIGVKHTFYTKSRRFCSMSCARGELYSLVVNNTKMAGGAQQQQAISNSPVHDHIDHIDGAACSNNGNSNDIHQQNDTQRQQSDIELALRVAHIKNSNYRFRITDQSKITQINGFGEPIMSTQLSSGMDAAIGLTAINSEDGALSLNAAGLATTPKVLQMYRDVLPQEDLPQIPKFERLPVSCPQMEKIISIRRRMYDPTHSFDWTSRLSRANFFAAPVTCFPHAPGYEVWDSIGIEMKVEVENTDCDNTEVVQPGQTPHSFWVATILNICGYKALMRYEGFDEPTHDFWVNLCNAEVHSVGWCATRGKPLIPPRTIENKYKDWKDFLVERLSGARTLPSSFYNKINDSMQSRFRLGLNLECVDKDRISQVRLATVTKIVGKRLFLRYFDSDDGFWCHEDSPIIHPVGWATTVGHNLAAPQDYLERMLAGREAMIEVHEDDATIELFKMNFTFEEYYMDGKGNGFVEGMKLEAVDPLNLSSICAATVMAVLKFGYIMIRIDSYQPDATGSDWFCYHEKSPSIFPVGFCASNRITLTPPNGFDVNTFSWETYLQETGSIAAGQHLFHRIVPNHGFEVGMSLECADLMDPRLVCVATVARVVGRLLKIHFDGWTDEYDQWLDCESPDVYPVGWCVLVNHKLEGPPMPVQSMAKVNTKAKSPKKRKKKSTNSKGGESLNAAKPRTIALKTNPHLPKLSIKLELKPEHHNAAFYEDNEDDDDDIEYEDDSTSHRSGQSTPLSHNEMSQHALMEKTTAAQQTSTSQPPTQARCANATVKKSVSPAPPGVVRKATSYIGNSSVCNSKYIPRLIESSSNDNNSSGSSGNNNSQNADPHADLMPDTWNVYDVSQFLRVNDCTAHCDTFLRNKIDGKRLLQLSKDEIITLLGMKVGPALKISDLIQQLKCRVNPGKSRMHKANKTFL